MNANMAPPVGIVDKTFVADVTFVGTLSSVGPRVDRKTAPVTEAQGTEAALIRAFSGVNKPVTIQIGGAPEPGLANSACVWAFASVGAAVTCQVGILGERVRT